MSFNICNRETLTGKTTHNQVAIRNFLRRDIVNIFFNYVIPKIVSI